MSGKKFNEDTLSEKPAIEQLKRLGYKYIHGDQLDHDLKEDCERKSRRDIENRLREINFPDRKLELFTREVLELARARFKD
jgi:DNA replication protein DnaC